MFSVRFCVWLKNSGSRTLFIGPTGTFFSQKNFKIGSYGIIYIFKNYFVTIFLIFNRKHYPNKTLEKQS